MHKSTNIYMNNWLVFTSLLAVITIGYMTLSRVEAGQDIDIGTSTKGAQKALFVDAKTPPLSVGGMTSKARDADYPAAYRTALRNAIQAQRLSSITLSQRRGVQQFYKQRNYRPVWTRLDREPGRNYQALLQRLEESWTHGLNPDQYRVKLLQELQGETSASAVATRDILASDALIRYVSDLVGPRTMDKQYADETYGWRRPVDTLAVLQSIGGGRDLDHMIDAFLPNSQTYSKMRGRLRELARQYRHETDEKRVMVDFDGILRPGDSHDAVRQLRKRLDVPPQHNRPDHVYSDPLAKKITAFQAKNGLDTDAIVGPATREAMNRGQKDKIEQLIANMQRMRWLAPGRPDRYLLVNIPAARLWAVDNGRVVHRMDVIAGRPSRETPSFVTNAEGVRLNPEWSIPYTVKFRDVLPKIRKDPGYLAENNIRLVQGYGHNARQIDPGAINWEDIARSKLARMRMIQQPGKNNPLGNIRILMPNRFSIFLHDTDKPEYFEKGRYWISSGCVRMHEPEKIADFVMNTTPEWSQAKMQQALKRKETVDLKANAGLPVYFLYHTVWQRGDGQLVFGPDIYNRDNKLVAELREANQIHIPGRDELPVPDESTLVNDGTQDGQDMDRSLKTGKVMRLLSRDDPA